MVWVWQVTKNQRTLFKCVFVFKGINGIHLIPTDPLFVPEINIIQGSDSPVNIKLNLKNANFIGFSAVDVTRVK